VATFRFSTHDVAKLFYVVIPIASYVYSCFINFLLLDFDSWFNLRVVRMKSSHNDFDSDEAKSITFIITDFWIATPTSFAERIVEKQLKLSTDEPCGKDGRQNQKDYHWVYAKLFSQIKGVLRSNKARKPALQDQPLNKNAIKSSSSSQKKKLLCTSLRCSLEGTLCQCR